MCLKNCSYKIKLNHSTYIQFFYSVFWTNFAWKTTLITLLFIDKSIYQMWPKHFLANWRLAFTRAIFAPPNDLFLFFMTLGAIMALWLCSPLHNKINQLASKKNTLLLNGVYRYHHNRCYTREINGQGVLMWYFE